MPPEYLALVDVDQIKPFIFAAPYLREIRGGSGILAKLHDPHNINEIDARVSRRERPGKLLYAGGGSVLAKFTSSIEAQTFIADEASEIEKRTKGGATLTGITQEIGEEGFGPAILRAQARLHEAKSRRHTLMQSPHNLLLKPCQSCGSRPSQTFNRRRARFVCTACDERIRRGGEKQRLHASFIDGLEATVKQNWESAETSEDLEALAATSNNYIGLIRADGNAMGERIKLLAGIGDENLFGEFSRACRDATEESVLEALRRAYDKPRSYHGQQIHPFEFVIVGGDDVEIITTADCAIQVALDFCDEFTTRMSQFAQTCGRPELAVAMSASVVFAQSSYPLSSLDDLAGQLLKVAKSRSRRLSPKSLDPTVDFMTITAATSGSVKAVREEYVRDRRRLTQRPYTTAELRRLIDVIKEMKHPPSDGAPFPRNKLRSLYELFFPSHSKERVEMEYLILQRRLSDQGTPSHRELLQNLSREGGAAHPESSPWREVNEHWIDCETCLVDAVELYDFVSEADSVLVDGN